MNSTDNPVYESQHIDVDKHYEEGDNEGLMRSFTQVIDQSTQPEYVVGVNGIHAPTTNAPKHWYRRKLRGWIHTHLVPEGFRTAVEKKYGNFVIVRSTGEYHYEEMPLYTRIGMHLLFSGYYRGKMVNSNLMHDLFLKESVRQGIYFNKPESVKQIPSFISHYSIDMEEFVPSDVSQYQNFNEFFTRAILPEKRPISEPENDQIIVSAADCRLNVFESVTSATQLWIKGQEFTLPHLLQNETLAEELEGGALAVFRLAPQDYHRFHIPTNGTVESISDIQGTYYTVNPCVVNANTNVFTDNHRSVVTVQSPLGFRYAVVCIGALLVGSIVYTNAEENKELVKGQEMGYFQYGGSTVIVVFPKDRVQWDDDVLTHSNQSVETLLNMGEGIGRFI
ncbi:phosphatidylserine decarboxylase-domain-containing protein [Sporodiniella umbellata]|nr:phosphatidylserine decarboxylase-domain-containing protein [Sporodiniella umbellata]